MSRYYTRACNFYYGNQSKTLVKKNKTIPFNQMKEISFNQIEILTRKSKKKIFMKQIKDLQKLQKMFYQLFAKNFMLQVLIEFLKW